jgi:hypothetical protein
MMFAFDKWNDVLIAAILVFLYLVSQSCNG